MAEGLLGTMNCESSVCEHTKCVDVTLIGHLVGLLLGPVVVTCVLEVQGAILREIAFTGVKLELESYL